MHIKHKYICVYALENFKHNYTHSHLCITEHTYTNTHKKEKILIMYKNKNSKQQPTHTQPI